MKSGLFAYTLKYRTLSSACVVASEVCCVCSRC